MKAICYLKGVIENVLVFSSFPDDLDKIRYRGCQRKGIDYELRRIESDAYLKASLDLYRYFFNICRPI